MLPFDGSSLKGVVVGAEAMVAGLLVNRWLELPLDLVVVGIPALGPTYLGLLLALGVSDEDRLVFGMLTQRFYSAEGQIQERTPGSRTQIGDTRTFVGSTSPSRSVAQALMLYLWAWSMTEKVRLQVVEVAFGWAKLACRVV
jgi:hypothetical protein